MSKQTLQIELSIGDKELELIKAIEKAIKDSGITVAESDLVKNISDCIKESVKSHGKSFVEDTSKQGIKDVRNVVDATKGYIESIKSKSNDNTNQGGGDNQENTEEMIDDVKKKYDDFKKLANDKSNTTLNKIKDNSGRALDKIKDKKPEEQDDSYLNQALKYASDASKQLGLSGGDPYYDKYMKYKTKYEYQKSLNNR